jgi:hypothetical protein
MPVVGSCGGSAEQAASRLMGARGHRGKGVVTFPECLPDGDQLPALRVRARLHPDDFPGLAELLKEPVELRFWQLVDHMAEHDKRVLIDLVVGLDLEMGMKGAGAFGGEPHGPGGPIVQGEALELPRPCVQDAAAGDARAARPIHNPMALGSPAALAEFAQGPRPFPPDPLRERAVVEFQLGFTGPIIGFASGAGEKPIPQLAEGFEFERGPVFYHGQRVAVASGCTI